MSNNPTVTLCVLFSVTHGRREHCLIIYVPGRDLTSDPTFETNVKIDSYVPIQIDLNDRDRTRDYQRHVLLRLEKPVTGRYKILVLPQRREGRCKDKDFYRLKGKNKDRYSCRSSRRQMRIASKMRKRVRKNGRKKKEKKEWKEWKEEVPKEWEEEKGTAESKED